MLYNTSAPKVSLDPLDSAAEYLRRTYRVMKKFWHFIVTWMRKGYRT